MSPVGQDESSDRPSGSWAGESDQPPYRHDADGSSESAIEPTTRDDDRSHVASQRNEPSHDRHAADLGNDSAEPPHGMEPPHRVEPVVPADGNGSGAASAVAGPDPELADQPPSGPPKRGWWKRLIE